MATDLGASVIRHVMQQIKLNGGTISDAHGQQLSALTSAEDLQLLQAASSLVARPAVHCYTAQPSQRQFFRVDSLQRFHHQRQQQHDVSDMSFGSMNDSVLLESDAPSYYNCFTHYCTCPAFEAAASKSPTAMVSLLLGSPAEAMMMN